MTKEYINAISYQVIGAAIEVHKALGPGLLESVYEKCFVHELKSKKLECITQVRIPINYKGLILDADLRLDILVEDLIIVELKAMQFLLPVHEAQVLSYMKLLQKPKGYIFNFHTDHIIEDMKILVNDYYGRLPEA